ncbi:MAG: Asp-tRNA(Asn)/Glu-tRNA(Gln) amidotransferase subunit GatB [Gammaproteobacteria bacterium]|nr:Asp-tRNA(Asn)/Glu-tRNA(Gln) amidotransferase subunit GatB [Gammaproteobacteria bacterium]
MQWEPVIGLEIHVQLATVSKIFSGASTKYGTAPNTQACAIDLGLPGVLPVVNARAIEMAILFGLAINARIASSSVFARKNYFYPDLPKGYQISQYEHPIVADGYLDLPRADGSLKRISIRRAHLEEDAGKSVHDLFPGATGVDLNRAGTPLLEVVSEPDLATALEAVQYMRAIHTLVRFIGICDGNMQEGSFRCDANVSVRPVGSEALGTRAEIKNLNSFRFIERAINYEIERQTELLENGRNVVQETRLYDPDRDETRSMRNKEDAHDYRYFPDPDLLPIRINTDEINAARARLPELPASRRIRYVSEFGLSEEDADSLSGERTVCEYFEALAQACGDPTQAANWVVGELFAAVRREGIDFSAVRVGPAALAQLLLRIRGRTISNTTAKLLFKVMWNGWDGTVDELIAGSDLQQVSDTDEISKLIAAVIADSPQQVAQYRAGKEKIFGYFVGQVMRRSGGKADPQQLNVLLKSALSVRDN